MHSTSPSKDRSAFRSQINDTSAMNFMFERQTLQVVYSFCLILY